MKHAIAALFEYALDQLVKQGTLATADRKLVQMETARDPAHGDLATNVAMIHAKSAGMTPHAFAQALLDQLQSSEDITDIKIEGPGFINIRLAQSVVFLPISQCLDLQAQYGFYRPTKERVQVEYVSANPTGPLHVGHGRGAAYGATLVNLLKARGHSVRAEYYVNDAGRQMNILALSVYLRYLERCGELIQFPSAGYQGTYISDLGSVLYEAEGVTLKISSDLLVKDLEADSEATKDPHIDGLIQNVKSALGSGWMQPFELALSSILEDIKNDLSEFKAEFDEWFSENSLVESGEIDQAIQTLNNRGHLVKKDGALWFKSTEFGDDKDRVVRRDNGTTTYFASDIAYIANKFARGFDRIIYVWGADHHGYMIRIKAAAQALGFDPERLIIRLVQFAILYKEGDRIPMSTRSGSFVTLRDLRSDVGRDACRYFYTMRKADQHLDFDLSLATSQSKDNPVYYVQYAHARICRVFESLDHQSFDQARGIKYLDKLSSQDELDLATQIGKFPEVVAKAADTLEAHLLCYYLQELAADFHHWYNGTRLLVDDLNTRDARLAVARCVQIVLKNGLNLLGVSAPEIM